MDEHTKTELRAARESYERREYEKCEPILRRILPQVDDFADVHNMLGVIAHDRQDFELAERCFERALQLNPRYTEAALNLTVTYNDLGKYDLAREVHEKATAQQRPNDGLDPFARGKLANMHADLAQAYVEAGLPREAIPELERAVSLCPHFADLRCRLGILYRELGDLRRARAQFEAAKAANDRYAPARVQLAMMMIAANERSAAEEELRDVLLHDPEHKTAQMYLRMLKSMAEAG